MKDVKEVNAAPDIADVVGILVVLDKERFLIGAGKEFQQLVDAVKDTNKAGEITIKLKVTPTGWKRGTGLPDQVDVEPIITAKIPRHDLGKSMFFLTDDNKLTRENPDQEKLEFQPEERENGRR